MVCLWYRYYVALTTGERVYRDLNGEYVGIV